MASRSLDMRSARWEIGYSKHYKEAEVHLGSLTEKLSLGFTLEQDWLYYSDNHVLLQRNEIIEARTNNHDTAGHRRIYFY